MVEKDPGPVQAWEFWVMGLVVVYLGLKNVWGRLRDRQRRNAAAKVGRAEQAFHRPISEWEYHCDRCGEDVWKGGGCACARARLREESRLAVANRRKRPY
jgi:hypothetical protein